MKPRELIEAERVIKDLQTEIERLKGELEYTQDAALNAQKEVERLKGELESHSWDISPEMYRAKIDDLNKELERDRRDRIDRMVAGMMSLQGAADATEEMITSWAIKQLAANDAQIKDENDDPTR